VHRLCLRMWAIELCIGCAQRMIGCAQGYVLKDVGDRVVRKGVICAQRMRSCAQGYVLKDVGDRVVHRLCSKNDRLCSRICA
jgi:hypothetical protein